MLVASGLGAALNPPRDGDRSADNSLCMFAPEVAIGRISAPVIGCLLGDFPGLYWVYVSVPPETPRNAAPVQLRVNGVAAAALNLPIAGPAPAFPAISVSRVEHPEWNGPTRDDKQYNPTSLIAITAKNLRPNAPAYIECTDGNGYDGLSPALKVTETYAIVPAPFYIDKRTGDYTSGTVSCVLGQKLADSNVVSTQFQIGIQAPPKLPGNPGVATLELVLAASQGARRIQGELTLKQSGGGGTGFSAAGARARMDDIVAAYAPYVAALRAISSGKQSSATAGTAANGAPLTLTRDALAESDRWIAMMLKEAHASTLYNEEFQPPPIRVHTSVTAAGLSPEASIFGTLTGLLRECVNIPGYLVYKIGQIVGSNEPDPSQACAALAKVPQAAADALVEATQGVGEDLSRIAKIAAFAAVPVGAEAEAAAVLARMSAVNSAIQTGAAAIDHVIALLSPDSPERPEILQRTNKILSERGADVVSDNLKDFLKAGIHDLYGEEGSQPYELVHDTVNLAKKLSAENEELAQIAAEIAAPAVARMNDGSNALESDDVPSELNMITGRIAGPDKAPLDEGYIELGDGDRISTPYGVAIINPDGSYSVQIPKGQVGKTIPIMVPLQVDVPDPSGRNPMISYSGPAPIDITKSQTLPGYQLPSASGGGSSGGGGGNCLYACRAD